MQFSLDVVDLLQLQEIWSKSPIVTAFTRLQPRPTPFPNGIDFEIGDLLPRLSRLKRSPVWLLDKNNLQRDPARTPISQFSDDLLTVLYPEAPFASAQREEMFQAAYTRFLMAHYRDAVAHISTLLVALAQVRAVNDSIGPDGLPLQGSPEWIPATITDEIRGLDTRYDTAEPGTPAAYVVSDEFWPLLLKAAPADVEQVVARQCPPDDTVGMNTVRQSLSAMIDVANAWYRSPSVVGLCYQLVG